MEFRIRKDSLGDYIVEEGMSVKSQPNPCGIGQIMEGFIVYSKQRFDTEKQATKYIKSKAQ